jgi:hypothetical protein
MPFSSGTYSLPSGNPVVTGTTISSTTTNTTNSDIATALSSCILKDGTQTVTANIPMASHKITGLSAGTTAGDSVEYAGSPSFTNLAYTGTLTGSTGILDIGSGQVYKDASGNVGIGTASPSAKLVIEGGTTSDQFRLGTGGNYYKIGREAVSTGFLNFYGSQSGANGYVFGGIDGERMRIDSTGNVGIGASSFYNTTTDVLTVRRSQNDITQLLIDNQNVGASSQTRLALEASGGGWYIANQKTGNPLTFSNNTAERMRIDSSGNLLVGTTTPPTAGHGTIGVKGAGTYYSFGSQTNGSTSFVVFNGAGTGVYLANGGTSWTATSDERLKTDLIPIENGLDKVNSLRSVTGRFKTDEEGVSRSFLIAQDVQAVLPEAVSVQDDDLGTLGVAYTEVIPLLVASIKELKAIIDTQQEQINSLLK